MEKSPLPIKVPSFIVLLFLILSPILATFYTVPAEAYHYIKSLGTIKVLDSATYYSGSTYTQLSIYLRYGDNSNFRNPQVVSVSWDGNVVASSLLVYHLVGILDDQGNIVETFVDARAGGAGSKANIECYLGPEICYEYRVVEEYKAFRDYKLAKITKTYKLYIEASTEAEAAAKAEARLLFVSASISINSVVRVGTYYEVTATAEIERRIACMAFDGTLEEWIKDLKTGDKYRVGFKNFGLVADKIYTAMNP